MELPKLAVVHPALPDVKQITWSPLPDSPNTRYAVWFDGPLTETDIAIVDNYVTRHLDFYGATADPDDDHTAIITLNNPDDDHSRLVWLQQQLHPVRWLTGIVQLCVSVEPAVARIKLIGQTSHQSYVILAHWLRKIGSIASVTVVDEPQELQVVFLDERPTEPVDEVALGATLSLQGEAAFTVLIDRETRPFT